MEPGQEQESEVGAILDGGPVLLIKNGEWQQDIAERTGVIPEDVAAAARGSDVVRAETIEYAVLERHGHMSVLKKEN